MATWPASIVLIFFSKFWKVDLGSS